MGRRRRAGRPALIAAAAAMAVAGSTLLPLGHSGPAAAGGVPSARAVRTDPDVVTVSRAELAAAGPAAVRVVAVGDIASATGSDDAVADLVASMDPDALLLLGDIAYPSGSPADFARYFAPDWQRFSRIWIPVPGNHEYRTPGVAGYRQAFDVPTGPLHSTHRVGAWRVIGLDSETSARAAQLAWLRSTLAAHDGEPTVVMWHRPRYSSGMHGDAVDTDDLWDVVTGDQDVRLVLWGHDHNYERMSVPVPRRDPVAAMVVGTGGGTLRPTPELPARSWREFYVDGTTGVLDLRLGATSFSWQFVTPDGAVLDRGSQDLLAPRARVRLRAVQGRSKLRVNVNPNVGDRFWRFTVQRQRADGTWARKKTYRTRGTSEVRTVNQRRGTYRVRVKAKFGYRGVRSRTVTLRR